MTIKSLYPASRPALGIDFAKTKRLDPRVAFTRASTATYVDNGGVIRTAGSGVARFDHNPSTGESLGLLVEPAATNLRTLSTNFSSGWDFSGNVTVASGQTSPTGDSTASLVTINAGTFTARIGEKFVFGGTVYTRSLFVKKTNQRYIWCGDQNNGNYSPNYRFDLDLVTGTVVSGGGFNSGFSITPFSNGYYRISVSCSSGDIFTWTANNNASLNPLPSSGSAVHDGTESFIVWGYQIEQASSSTSYIPTSGSTVTRAADVATLSNANSSIFPTSAFTTVNTPFGTAGGGSTVKLVGPTIKRTAIYDGDLPQAQINTLTNTGDFWRWRVLGSSFALPSFTTNGSVTVDWGDGVVETLTTAAHTFTNGGGYHDIGFRLNSGTYFAPFINTSATYKDRVIAVGPAPASMRINPSNGFRGCTALRAFDATVDATGGTNFIEAWQNCSSLTSFPLINTSTGTNFQNAWDGCTSLVSFPLISTAAATNFNYTWRNCSSLTFFAPINAAAVTGFTAAWQNCSSLTSFPLISTGAGISFQEAWQNCSSFTSFPLINTAAGTNFQNAWGGCTGLTSFPLISTGAGTTFFQAWTSCSSLTGFTSCSSWTLCACRSLDISNVIPLGINVIPNVEITVYKIAVAWIASWVCCNERSIRCV
jgi:hypothetical protein